MRAAALLLLAPACDAAADARDLLRGPRPGAARAGAADRPAVEIPVGAAAGVRLDATWRPDFSEGAPPVPLEKGLDYLRKMLQTALVIEHATIPAYLTALYSIPPGGANSDAAKLLRGIVIEEMLHMTNAANVLNAVGGHPEIDRPGFVPEYPGSVPFVEFNLSVTPFSPSQSLAFRKLEEPVWGNTKPGPTGLRTVADLYAATALLMELLCKVYGEEAVFTGNQSLQVSANSSRGEVVAVYNLKDALNGILGVVRQGEGGLRGLNDTSPFSNKTEHAHYFRCDEMARGRFYQESDNGQDGPTGDPLDTDWTKVHDFIPNTKVADFQDYPDVHLKLSQFAGRYTDMLVALHNVFNGAPEKFMPTIGMMYELSSLARELAQTPAPGNSDNKTLGPPWEWVANHSEFRGGWTGISL